MLGGTCCKAMFGGARGKREEQTGKVRGMGARRRRELGVARRQGTRTWRRAGMRGRCGKAHAGHDERDWGNGVMCM